MSGEVGAFKVEAVLADIEASFDKGTVLKTTRNVSSWSSWFLRHGEQIAKGGLALVGLVALGGIGYVTRGKFWSSQEPDRPQDAGPETDVTAALAKSTIQVPLNEGSKAMSQHESMMHGQTDTEKSPMALDVSDVSDTNLEIAEGKIDFAVSKTSGDTATFKDELTSSIQISTLPSPSTSIASKGPINSDLQGRVDLFGGKKLLSAPTERWVKAFGGSGQEVAQSIQQTSDGGYIVSGHTTSAGAGISDIFVIKLNSSGDSVWAKTFGGTMGDGASFVLPTADGGYLGVGNTNSVTSNNDFIFFKLDSLGDKIWAKAFGNASSYDSVRSSIQQTTDNGYVCGGITNGAGAGGYDGIILKLDSLGSKVWAKVFGGAGDEEVRSVQQTSDGGYVAAGNQDSKKIFVLKLDSTGNQTWTNVFGIQGNNIIYSMQQTLDGGYIVGGATNGLSAGGYDFLLLKLDTYGNQIWAKTFGGSSDDYAFSAQQTTDGGYIVVGYTSSVGAGGFDALVLRLDGSGNKLWAKTFGGVSDEYAYSIQKISDGGYIVAGYTCSIGAGNKDILVIKLDSTGNISNGCWGQNVSWETVNCTTLTTTSVSWSIQDLDWSIVATSALTFQSWTPATVTACQSHIPVVANSIPDQMALTTQVFSYTFPANTFTDADGDTLTYTATLGDGSTLPSWLGFTSATRTFSGTPTATRAMNVTVSADDGYGGVVSDTFQLMAYAKQPLFVKTFTEGLWYNTIAQTSDGGYIAGGEIPHFGVVKFDSSWKVAWRRVYTTTGNADVYSIQETLDNGFIAAGMYYNNQGVGSALFEGLLVKLDSSGTRLWSKAFGGGSGSYNPIHAVRQTSDGKYIAVGSTDGFGAGSEDIFILKLGLNGNQPGVKTFGGNGHDYPGQGKIGLMSDGSYVVTGQTDSSGGGGSYDIFVFRANSDDTMRWAKRFGGGDSDSGIDIQPTSDGGCIVVGTTSSVGVSGADALMIKLNGNGSVLWMKTFGGSGNDEFYSIQPTSDGGYVLTGVTTSTGGAGGRDVLALKVDSNINVVWARGYGTSGRDDGASAIQTSDGEYIVVGRTDDTSPHSFMMKLDANGNCKIGCYGQRDISWEMRNATLTEYPISWTLQDASASLTVVDAMSLAEQSLNTMPETTICSNNYPIVSVPVATQASCCTASVGYTFSFPFSTSTFFDPDGEDLTFTATKGDGSALPGWLSFNSATRTFSGTPNAASYIGNLALKVIASDPSAVSVYDTFTLTISGTLSATNTSTAITYTEDTQYSFTSPIVITTPSSTATATLTLNDLSAGTLSTAMSGSVSSTYTAGAWRASGAISDVNTLLSGLKFTPALNKHDAFSIAVSIVDGYGQSTSDSIAVTGIAVNDAPFVNNTILGQTSCCTGGVGQSYSFTFAANTFADVDGDALTYTATKTDGSTLPSWLSFNAGTRTLSGTPNSHTQLGDLNVKVTAKDPSLASVSDTFTLSVAQTLSATNTNAAIGYTEDTQYSFSSPIVITTPSSTATVTLTLNDPGIGVLSMGVNGSVASSFNTTSGVWRASGAKANVNTLLAGLKFTPAANKHDAFSVAVSITDGYGQSLTDTMNAIGTPVNDAPTVTNTIATQSSCCSAGVGQLYSFAFASNTFTDVDGDTLTYTATKSDNSALPGWLSFSAGTRTLSGTPNSNSQVGNLDIKVTANDGNGGTVSDTFTLQVTNTLSATNTASTLSYLENTAYDLDDMVITTPSATVIAQLTLSNTAAGSFSTATSGGVTSTYNAGTGVWRASGNLANVNALLAGVKYQPATDYHGAFTVAVSITDSYSQSLTDTLTAPALAPPTLVQNTIRVPFGSNTILTTSQLSATDANAGATSLTFTITNPAHGHFELVGSASSITSFTKQQIMDQLVKMIQDGTSSPFAFNVKVSNGRASTGVTSVTTSINYGPSLVKGSITIGKGESVVLTVDMLNAQDVDDTPDDLTFTISNMSNGRFELTSNPGVIKTSFTLRQIMNHLVRLVQTGSSSAPVFDVTVSDGQTTTAPEEFATTFKKPSDSSSEDSNASLVGGIAAGGGVLTLGTVALGVAKWLKKRAEEKKRNRAKYPLVTAVDTALKLDYFTFDESYGRDFKEGLEKVVTALKAARLDTSSVLGEEQTALADEIAQAIRSCHVTITPKGIKCITRKMIVDCKELAAAASKIAREVLKTRAANGDSTANMLKITRCWMVLNSGEKISITPEMFEVMDHQQKARPELKFSIKELAGGSFQASGGTLLAFTQGKVAQGGVEFISEVGAVPSFQVQVSDEQEVHNIEPVIIFNQKPHLLENAIRVGMGQEVKLSRNMLRAEIPGDADTTKILYKVKSVSNGKFFLDGTDKEKKEFTQTEVDDGLICFKHMGKAEDQPKYEFTVGYTGLTLTPAQEEMGLKVEMLQIKVAAEVTLIKPTTEVSAKSAIADARGELLTGPMTMFAFKKGEKEAGVVATESPKTAKGVDPKEVDAVFDHQQNRK